MAIIIIRVYIIYLYHIIKKTIVLCRLYCTNTSLKLSWFNATLKILLPDYIHEFSKTPIIFRYCIKRRESIVYGCQHATLRGML